MRYLTPRRALPSWIALLLLLFSAGASAPAQTSVEPARTGPRGWRMPSEAELRLRSIGLSSSVSALASAAVDPAPFDDHWDDQLGSPGVSGKVFAMATIGTDVYVAGQFHHAGGIYVSNIARWDGRRWRPLVAGNRIGVDGTVLTLAVQRGRLIVGGQFAYAGDIAAGNVAVWDPETERWSTMGDGMAGDLYAHVAAVAVRGDEIYAAGHFDLASSIRATNIARWDGTKWNRVGAAPDDDIFVLRFVGDDLYAGGKFGSIGDVEARHIARWDGTAWSPLSVGTSGPVHAIAASQAYIYVGGEFDSAGAGIVRHIARWSRATSRWDSLGGGAAPLYFTNATYVYGIDVRGSEVYAGGHFALVDGLAADHIAMWDERESAWKNIDSGVFTDGHKVQPNITTVMATDDHVYIGGEFLGLGNGLYFYGNVITNGVAVLDDGIWAALGTSVNGPVHALTTTDRYLYVGGQFAGVEGMSARNIVRRDHETGEWSRTGYGIDEPVHEIVIVGDWLYVATEKYGAGRVLRRSLAGGEWDSLVAMQYRAQALAIEGDDIYVGLLNGLYRSNRGQYIRLTDTATALVRGSINALAIDGDDLYVGGAFVIAERRIRNFARYDLTEKQWYPVGDSVDGPVTSIVVGRDEIYIGGRFTGIGSVEVANIAMWSKAEARWYALGAGLNAQVNDIAVAGTVYAIGSFTASADVPVRQIARWTGENWAPLGSGVGPGAERIAAHGDDVFVGGTLDTAGSFGSYRFARWNRAVAGVETTAAASAGSQITADVAPNPFSTAATIRFDLPHACHTTVTLHDVRGAVVATLLDDQLAAGRHAVRLPGESLPAGSWFYRIRCGAAVRSGSVVLVR